MQHLDGFHRFSTAEYLAVHAKHLITNEVFFNYLQDKRKGFAFNRRGEVQKAIVQINNQTNEVTVRGSEEQIKRWGLFAEMGKRHGHQLSYELYIQSCKDLLDKSFTRREEMTREDKFKPSI